MPRTTASLDDAQYDWVTTMADDWDCSHAEVIRRCITHVRECDATPDADADPGVDAAGDAPDDAPPGGVEAVAALADGLDVDLERALVERRVEPAAMPGRTRDARVMQAEAVVAMVAFLRDAGSASPQEIRAGVYESTPANYASAMTWWENLKPVFAALPCVEQVTVRRWEYRPLL